MHIKEITIQGFRTYKAETHAAGLSPHHNVVVGRNGSGKSNFFEAIQFVLGDKHKHLGSREERQKLLHQGPGRPIMSAFVEIILDNTDRRFTAIDSAEVKIRRTVGVKKDEYSVNSKSVTRQEIMNLLESAGFSQANPYYIVPQGRITGLTNASKVERLNVLKDVAGTEVYDKKKADSLNILEDTERHRDKIRETLQQINQRLEELEEEKDQLVAYQQLETEKRSLEHLLYSRELDAVSKSIDKLVDSGIDKRELVAMETSKFIQLEENFRSEEENILKIDEEIQILEREENELREDLEEVITNNAKSELKLLEIEENRQKIERRQQERKEEADELVDEIEERERELNEIIPQFELLKENEQNLRESIDLLENQRNRLELKRGQNSKFISKDERDEWLNNEISDLNKTIAARKDAISNLENEVSSLNSQYNEITKSITSNRDELDLLQETHIQCHKKESELNLQKDKLVDERKSLWREESRIEIALDNSEQKLNKFQQHLSGTMNRNTYLGLKSMDEIAKDLNIDGYHGMLADIIDVPSEYKVAVERTAGMSLFHAVVDNDDIATLFVKELSRRKAGRVTFIPLNRLQPVHHNYPERDDAHALISRLKYDERFAPAIKQTFGNMLLCKDLEVCNEIMRNYKFNTITMDGDRVDSKGVMSGGYQNPKNSRLDAVKNVDFALKEVDSLRRELLRIKNSITRKDQEITQIINQIATITNENLQIQYNAREIEEKIRSLILEESRIKVLLSTKQEDLVERKGSVKSLTDQYNSYKSDLNSPFSDNLSSKEITELNNIGDEIRKLRKNYQQIVNERTTIGEKKSLIESDLQGNLYVRRDQIKTNNIEFSEDTADNNEILLKDIKKQLESFSKQRLTLEEGLLTVEKNLEELNQLRANSIKNKSKIEEDQTTLGQHIEHLQKNSDKELSKKALLQSRKDNLNTKIRSLGTLPESVNEFGHLPDDEIISRQQVVTDELKKYSHINKRAAEQYRDSLEKQTNLKIRDNELTKALDEIKDLIKTLDRRKDEAINRTFKEVDIAFSEIFQKLVPDGIGKLVIERRPSNDGEKIEYAGVDIDVSFNSRNNEQQAVSQLSGGQKSLCALTLIFAIQRCDPAPFYLFDEIDANLDTQYRTAVAQMLKEQSEGAQYICTTFRPEMLTVADRFYGVVFKDKMSTIGAIEKGNAMDFIESAAQ